MIRPSSGGFLTGFARFIEFDPEALVVLARAAVLLEASHERLDGLAPPVTHEEARQLLERRDHLDVRAAARARERLDHVAAHVVQRGALGREVRAVYVRPPLGLAPAVDVRARRSTSCATRMLHSSVIGRPVASSTIVRPGWL